MSEGMRRFKGLSLIELIVVIAILSIVIAVSFPYYRNFVSVRSVDFWKDMLVSDLNRCRYNAIREELYWGINKKGDSSYEFIVSSDGLAFTQPNKPVLRRMDKDFAGNTRINSGFTINIYFSPRASIGYTTGSSWGTVGVYKDYTKQYNDFTITLQSGKNFRTVKVSRSGECTGSD